METIFTNARVVGRDRTFEGTVVVRGGRIATVDDAPSRVPGALDLGGDHLLPGLVEMHTDNLEKHFLPRPGVVWPSPTAAVISHDAQIAAAGITTVFDAVAVGDYGEGHQRRRILADAVEAVTSARDHGLLRAEHLLHLRCEVSDPGVMEIFRGLNDHPLVRLVSLMDHTPGQRQWMELSTYRRFHHAKGWTDAEFDAHLADRQEKQRVFAVRHRTGIVSLARERGHRLASHDDTTEDHVAEAIAEGITISEFPTTVRAARHARRTGMATVMGAPNVVRGGSHSGNASAIELAGEGVLDGLSSDYVPASLLHAAFRLADVPGLALNEAVAMVSANVADMLGLDDRGRIEPGRRADLVRVRLHDDLPVVRAVWRAGERVI